MKITSKGNIKIQRGDVRVGNFVIHTESDHYKIQDINSVFSVRASVITPVGQLLKAALENLKGGDENSGRFLHDYCAVFYNVLSVAPDYEFLGAVQKASVDCLNRHKDMYGIKDDPSKEEDDKILKEEVELAEAEKEARLEVLGHD